jgi:hypothetical protein
MIDVSCRSTRRQREVSELSPGHSFVTSSTILRIPKRRPHGS